MNKAMLAYILFFALTSLCTAQVSPPWSSSPGNPNKEGQPQVWPPPGMALIPAGEFEMGDHFGVCNPEESPVHAVYIDEFWMDIYEETNLKYCSFLNSTYGQGLIEVISGVVYKFGDAEEYCDTTTSSAWSRIIWDGNAFSVTAFLKACGIEEVRTAYRSRRQNPFVERFLGPYVESR